MTCRHHKNFHEPIAEGVYMCCQCLKVLTAEEVAKAPERWSIPARKRYPEDPLTGEVEYQDLETGEIHAEGHNFREEEELR